MAKVCSEISFVDLLCLLPNGWKDHPEGVTRLILVEEFRHQFQTHDTAEGLVVNIDDVEARSQHYCNYVWFRKVNGDEVEPDLVKYYPMKIQFLKCAKTLVQGMTVDR